MVTDTAPFRYPHYHEPSDTVDKIEFVRYAQVVDALANVIGDLARSGEQPKAMRLAWLSLLPQPRCAR
jgi:hypothetical protein